MARAHVRGRFDVPARAASRCARAKRARVRDVDVINVSW